MLVWHGLIKVGKDLTKDSFLAAVNNELTTQLATKEEQYHLLTSLSLDRRDIPRQLNVPGAEVCVLNGEYPQCFRSRDDLLREHGVPVQPTPASYCKVTVTVRAKSASTAVNKALRALDLQRALWCLMGNPRMQIFFGTPSLSPVNVVRLGSQHTLHLSSGEPAKDGIWFEPAFTEAPIFRIPNPKVVRSKSCWALGQISASSYGDHLISSLVRYVRALDDRDANTAFLKLWGVLEALTTPAGQRDDYKKLVRRCSFLFKESAFHRQILEHLREYRNENIHAGAESDNARIHCYQLQFYLDKLLWFHLGNATDFRCLDETYWFLDSPADQKELQRRAELTRKALRFIS
jgi:hypothetical protein